MDFQLPPVAEKSPSIDHELLARQIAAHLDENALLDAADIAALWKFSTRYVSEVMTKIPGFPEPVRLPGRDGKPGHPRWRKRDVIAYAEAHGPVPKASRGGRPRKQ